MHADQLQACTRTGKMIRNCTILIEKEIIHDEHLCYHCRYFFDPGYLA